MRHPDCQIPFGHDGHVEDRMAQQQSNPNQRVQGDSRQRPDTATQQDERDRKERYDPSEPERGRDNQDDNRENESDRSDAGAGRD